MLWKYVCVCFYAYPMSLEPTMLCKTVLGNVPFDGTYCLCTVVVPDNLEPASQREHVWRAPRWSIFAIAIVVVVAAVVAVAASITGLNFWPIGWTSS